MPHSETRAGGLVTPRADPVPRAAGPPGAPVVGETLHLREQDYRFGVGTLIATVSLVVAPVHLDNEPWWLIRAWCKRAPSDHGAHRELYVRAASMPVARTPGV